jgi:hypothetical protein
MTITDHTFNKSSLLLSLPMLLQPNEEQHSHTKSSPTAAANQTHSYREERTFIKSLP